ncbi:hypothetical protein [Flavobacterium luteum]|uniref:DUF4199 domain-containing protein n=1 Tax=Flavobacterium luteum TaxID=2026654 RepID=A0A7J5AH97_9FLAO|nr:hypothetical protein [Flavobacterium luteum]KAB1156890.1 hypothetical protein F6464_05935 [Flavobacterium luteum]
MKLPKELLNGLIIFIGISIYFLVMNALGYSNSAYLRVFNVLFVFYGVNRTIKMNLAEGKNNFVADATSAMITSVIGVALSVLGLLIYSSLKGGEDYLKTLSESFLFGGNPSINVYCFSLLFEGIASSVIVVLLLMLYWNSKHVSD